MVELEPILTLLLVAVVANLAVMATVLVPPMFGKRSPLTMGRQVDLGDHVIARFPLVPVSQGQASARIQHGERQVGGA